MEHSHELDTAVAGAHRRLIAERLPLFTGGWLAATVFWVVVAAGDPGATWLAVGLLFGAHGALFGLAVLVSRRPPPCRRLQAASVAICAATALAGTAFCVHLHASVSIIAMLLFAVVATSSLLFAWRAPVALLMFAATWGPWLLLERPWPALGLTPLQCLAGAVVGGAVFAVIAEAAFAGLRGTVQGELREAAQATALRASHDSYRALAEDAADLIWTADLDWRFTYVNPAAARHIGLPASQIVGVPLRTVLTTHPANADLEAAWGKVAAGDPQPPRLVQVRAGPLHPEPRWFEVSASPAHDSEGRVVGVRGASRDVTARVHAEERLSASERRYRGLVESQQALIVRCTEDGTLTFINDAYCAKFGRPRAELLGASFVPLVHPDDLDGVKAGFARLRTPPYRDVIFNRGFTPEGERWFEWELASVRDEHGTPIEIQAIGRDVTARKEAEDALHASLEALRDSEQKLRRLAHAQTVIREAERKRLGFNLHDDVCQELVGIGIMIEAVCYRLGSDAPDTGELRRAVGYLGEVVEHLRRLAGELRPLPLRDLGLEGALRSLAAGVSTAETRVEVAVPVLVPRLEEETEVTFYRVAHEAITNAIRYAAARTVTVRLHAQDGELRLDVKDDGRGFDAGAGRKSSIGLASMEERAIARGGQLTIQSAPGEGTLVTLVCALTATESASAA